MEKGKKGGFHSKGQKKFENDWCCGSCRFNNFSNNTVCYKCKAPKDQSELQASGSQQRQQPKPQGQGNNPKFQNDWCCGSCGLNNFSNNIECYRCKAPKGQSIPQVSSSQQRQPDMAPAAQSAQPKKQEAQVKKDLSKPDGKVPKAKDWICECGKKNFGKWNECKECKKPRKTEQEPPVQKAPPSQPPVIQQPQSSAQPMPNIQNLQINTSGSSRIETSPDGRVYEGKRGTKCKVEVNYGIIKLLNLPKECYHYDITFLPDTPKKMLTKALEQFMTNYFKGYVYGFDGKKNVYTAKKLLVKGTIIEQFTETVEARLLDRSKEFKVTIKYAATVDMSVLLNYKHPMYQNEDRPSTAVQVLDIILRSAFRRNIESGDAIPSGRAIYFRPDREREYDLGDGMELWYGLFQSAILGRKTLYLNTDVLHKAFPSKIPILEYLKTFDRSGRIPQELKQNEQFKLKEFLAMLSIGYRLNDREPLKTYGFNGLGPDATRASFTYNNQQMTVESYFKNVKKIPLKFPRLPVLWVGSRSKPEGQRTFLPIEFCEIPPGQATNKKCTPNCVRGLIKYSATSTDLRKQKIRKILDKISYNQDPTISGFGIDIDKKFEQTEARVIDPPKILYSGGRTVEPQRGVWNGENFLETEQGSIKWCILNCDRFTNGTTLQRLKQEFMKEAVRQRIHLNDVQSNEMKSYDSGNRNHQGLSALMDDLKRNGYRFILVVVNDFNNIYAEVKKAAELRVGILTQCIKSKTCERLNSQIVKNILLKLNAKLTGKNYEVQEISYSNVNSKASGVMFIGADVTHPSPDQKDIPSVVGVASSHDQVGFRYCCAWRLQNPKDEMIRDLENIIVEHLHFYKQKNKNVLPGKIMYYRDGVSDGQFKTVLDLEMSAIKRALYRIYGQNKHAEITFIVVQKRHHTRFFPTSKQFSDGKNNNILPGTVVDKDIIHPFQYQFFLASHAAIQGVTKPTKYCILINESKINPDDLQAVTYDLCHLFTRCNRAVSYPAPTYYAHLVAARGKNYILGEKLNMNNLQKEFEMRRINPNIVQNAPMFFV